MRTEQHIIEFSEFLTNLKSRLTPGQLSKAKKLLENVINSISYMERKNEKLEQEITGFKNEDYACLMQKFTDVITIMGFDVIQLSMMHRNELEFIIKNIGSIKKSGDLTADRIQNIVNLIKYHERTTGTFPEKMSNILESFNEIKNGKEQN